MTEFNDLSSVIGELRNFAAQQAVTNTHMLEELKKIGERMSTFGEVGAGLVEYRKTLHERFNRIHEMFGDVDERLDKLEHKVEQMTNTVTAWKAQMKTIIVVVGAIATVLSSIISSYGGQVLRSLAH